MRCMSSVVAYTLRDVVVRLHRRARVGRGPRALDLPGRSRRIRVEPVRTPDPLPERAPARDPAPEPPPEPAPAREPTVPAGA